MNGGACDYLLLERTWITGPTTGLETSGEGRNKPMVQEADFYTAEEAAKVLGIPVRHVFSMLCGGELEGHQDEWARWLVPASALQEARRTLKPSSYPDGLPEHDAGSRAAAEAETRVWDTAEITILSDGETTVESPVDAGSLSGEETTQETYEMPVGGTPASRTYTESSEARTGDRLSLDGGSGAAVSEPTLNETIKEITERLAVAAAKTRELRGRLELAEATEAALRESLESLERERRGIDRESTWAEQDGTEAERLDKEPAAGRGEGFWRGLFGG